MLSTGDRADGITLDTKPSLLIAPEFAEQMWHGDVVLATPDTHVRHRLLVFQKVEQTAKQLVVQARWTTLQTQPAFL